MTFVLDILFNFSRNKINFYYIVTRERCCAVKSGYTVQVYTSDAISARACVCLRAAAVRRERLVVVAERIEGVLEDDRLRRRHAAAHTLHARCMHSR